jgi:hypothetical protein
VFLRAGCDVEGDLKNFLGYDRGLPALKLKCNDIADPYSSSASIALTRSLWPELGFSHVSARPKACKQD